MGDLDTHKKSDVLFILPQLRYGGVQINRLKIMEGLSDKGVSLGLVIISPEEDLLDRMPAGIHYYGSVLGKNAFFNLFRLLAFLRRLRPKVIVSAYPDLNFLMAVLSLMMKDSPKLILSYHAAFAETARLESGLSSLKWILIKKFIPFTFHQAHSIIAVSKGLANELAALSGQAESPTKVSVIYNPIVKTYSMDRGCHSEGPHSLHENDTQDRVIQTITYVGRLEKQKNIPLLIKAFSEVLPYYPDTKLFLIGDGSAKNGILAYIKKLGIHESVQILGFVPDPNPFIATSDVLVLPSDFEGFGNVLVEAMACGTQVVSTDCPHGPREILQDGTWGQIVRVGDVAGLASAIKNVLSGNFFVEPKQLRARAAAFSFERAIEAYGRLVDDALNRQSSSGSMETLD